MWKAVEFNKAAKQRIAEAARFEKRERLEPFVNATVDIGGGIQLRQLTARDVVAFDFTDNALLTGKPAYSEDYGLFFWQLRPSSVTDDVSGYIAKTLRAYDKSEDARKGLKKYLGSQLSDMQSRGDKAEQDSPWPWIISAVDLLASEYGWSIDEIMDLPVKTIFMLFKQIVYRKSNYKICPSSRLSQTIKQQELKRISSNG
jgi:hypothetical protein